MINTVSLDKLTVSIESKGLAKIIKKGFLAALKMLRTTELGVWFICPTFSQPGLPERVKRLCKVSIWVTIML